MKRTFVIGEDVYIRMGAIQDEERYKLVKGKVVFVKKSLFSANYEVLYIENNIEKISEFYWDQLYSMKDIDGFRNSMCVESQREIEKNYQNFLNLLKEKSKNAISITEKKDSLIFLGEYVEEYPEIHIVEIYEDSNKTVYRLDKK